MKRVINSTSILQINNIRNVIEIIYSNEKKAQCKLIIYIKEIQFIFCDSQNQTITLEGAHVLEIRCDLSDKPAFLDIQKRFTDMFYSRRYNLHSRR